METIVVRLKNEAENEITITRESLEIDVDDNLLVVSSEGKAIFSSLMINVWFIFRKEEEK